MRVRFSTRREPPEQFQVALETAQVVARKTADEMREAADLAKTLGEDEAFERVLALARSPLPDEDD